MLKRWAAALLAAFLLAAPAAAQKTGGQGPGDFMGVTLGAYSVEGFNPDGSRYAGSAVMRVEGGRFHLEQRINQETFYGVGSLRGNTLTVQFPSGPAYYQINAGSELWGTWSNGWGLEVLRPE